MLVQPKKFHFSILLALLLSLTAAYADWPAGDLDGDDKVGLNDFGLFAKQWLDPSGCSGNGCADFDGVDGIDIKDLAILAGHWMQEYGLVINEFMASNRTILEDIDELGEFPDWIEIYNASGSTISLAGMYLTDNYDVPDKWEIPGGISVDSQGFVVFLADGDDDQGDYHTNFKIKAGGDDLYLFDTDATSLIDSVVFNDQHSDISYGRFPNGAPNWMYMGQPTHDADNEDGYAGQVDDTEFSVDRGFYESPFQVRLDCETDGAEIRYTLDGSDPVAPNGTVYNPALPIQITGTTNLRAKATKVGWLASNTDTQTYIFISEIVNQSATAPPGWPTGTVNGQVFDYGMDPDITTDPTYSDLIDDALLAIPTISLTTDMANLIDPTDGLYVNCGDYNTPGSERGPAWRRPASVELINPDGSKGFQINSGFGMRGVTSCRGGNPKHAFRLFFSSQYGGDGALEYPLFGDEGVDRFENLDLRCAANYSWNNDGESYNQYFTYIREVFCRDLQGQMGQPYSRSRYYHLYLNGIYWGLYQSQERANSNHGQAYLGGDSDDYDVVKPDRNWPRSMKCSDGTFDAYERLWQVCLDEFDTDQEYYEVQGLNTNGTVNPAYERLVDVNNIIDFMITIFYSGDFDSPISAWDGNATPNNFFGFYNRENPDGFKFFRHDGEHSMGVSHDVNRNRVGPFTNPALMNFDRNCIPQWQVRPCCIGFNPQTIHQHLIVHPEYKMLFADHVHKFFFNDGPMNPDNAASLFAERASQIDMAIIAESARWGDAKTNPPRTRDDWLGEVDWVINSYIPVRRDIVLGQLRNVGWYPDVDAPEFKVNGSFQHGGYVTNTDLISLDYSTGTAYYTLDGSDPRLVGGAVNPSASIYGDGSGSQSENFESGLGNWINVSSGDTHDWTRNSGETGSSNTGPSAGANGSSNYMYLETSSSGGGAYDAGDTAILEGPPVSGTNLQLSFYYHMYGSDMGTLNVDVYSGGSWTDGIWNLSGQQHTSNGQAYTQATVDLSGYSTPLKVRFRGVAAGNYQGDMAIDDIEITEDGGGGGDPTEVLTKSSTVKARVLDGSEWSALTDAIFAVGPIADDLRISEIMYHPQDPNEEFIEVVNTGPGIINLNLVKFTRGIDFTFGDIDLAAGQRTVAVRNIAAFEAQYGTSLNVAGQYDGSLDNSGERIVLEDAAGTVIHDFKFRDGWRDNTDGDGYSLTVINPSSTDQNSWAEKDGWRPSAHLNGSPSSGDDGIIPNPGAVMVNEVMAHTDASPQDWVELYNTTGSAINITGWYLSDDKDNRAKYQIPSMSIPGNGYVVLTQDDHFGGSFALSENGDEVYLTSQMDANTNLTGYRQAEAFGASENGVSFGRHQKSTGTYNFPPASSATYGTANAYPSVGPVVITEIMYHPEMFAGDWDAEYLELHNITGSSVLLYDTITSVPWAITDGVTFEFPASTSIPAGGVILLVKDITAFEGEFGPAPGGVQVFEWTSGSLSNGGEKVQLSKPGDLDGTERKYIRVDRINYSDGSHPVGDDPWPTSADGTGDSLQRKVGSDYGNDVENWKAASPAPGVAGAGWDILAYDDFEGGWGNYTDGGDDCAILTDPLYAHQGSNSANIQDDSGDASSFWLTNGIDVHGPGYTEINVEFWYYPSNMETGENFQLLYYDGSSWQTIETWVSGTDFSNDVFYSEEVIIPESTYNFPTDMKIKFTCDASGNQDDIYIDEVVVSGK
ncbi:MAG: hypothetical protein FVQ82_13920 [Planctomycetes bacterium]|nr:hypothetical protein [Planctomycetota bacterium]